MAEPASVVIHRRVQWFDTDASTKYHNTAPLRFMEEAEVELLDRLGILHDLYGWLPRAHATIEYRRPLRFWDEVDILVSVEDVGTSSVTYVFRIEIGHEVCTEGRVVAVFIDDAGRSRPLPEDYRRLLLGAGRLPERTGR
jgi:acyl-CoA thioester hydrolase